MYEIRSAGRTFRRCNTQFNKQPQTFPDDRFSDEELETLMNEKQLVVRKVDGPDKDPSDKLADNNKKPTGKNKEK